MKINKILKNKSKIKYIDISRYVFQLLSESCGKINISIDNDIFLCKVSKNYNITNTYIFCEPLGMLKTAKIIEASRSLFDTDRIIIISTKSEEHFSTKISEDFKNVFVIEIDTLEHIDGPIKDAQHLYSKLTDIINGNETI